MRFAFPVVLLLAPVLRAAEPSAADVFETRIVPIFKSPNPSSCVQCHLTGVDLKEYILPDAEKTFRSLRDQGLIDLAAPEKSKIVRLIERGSSPAAANSVSEKARAAERAAFLAWIAACAADPKLKDAPKAEPKDRAAPPVPAEVIRHARQDRLLASFENNVWAWRFRCMNCHTEGTPQNDKLVKEHGASVAWFKKGGAAATMDHLLASKLIDLAKPELSLLLRKPLGEKHGGGVKFVIGDDAYKGFRAWIEDVAAIRTGKYTAAKDLPPADTGPEKFGTDLWLKLTDTPAAWGDQFVRVQVFAWDDHKKAWEESPVAVSDRVVFGKGKLWQHTLTLLAAKDSERAKAWKTKPARPDGRYLAKVFVDADARLKADWKAEWRDADFAGAVEFRARWREGYAAMTAVDASKAKK